MQIIAFDQASLVSGWSLFDNGEYKGSGTIKKSNKIPIGDRIPQMAIAICKMIRDNGCDFVVIENIQQQRSPQTTIELARLQGCIMMYCASKGITLKILEPTAWRKILEFRQGPKIKKEELKQQAVDYAKEHFGVNVEVNDESDAICIGAAACKLYNTK